LIDDDLIELLPASAGKLSISLSAFFLDEDAVPLKTIL
jgi:hypothetical protein